jgi:cytochrome c oxidase subunit I+III
VRFTTPLMFVIGFFFIFIIGGLTGVMLASVSLDSQLHDSYFVVAHLHYVLIGGALFPLFGAIYYWFPKWTGRMLSETVGKWNFWLFFIGFNVTFFPMHILGLDGMTRRIYTYAASSGWGNLNLLASIGAFIIAVSMLVFFGNVVRSLRIGARASANPWEGATLEWATDSPPPAYGFAEIPVVQSRQPLLTGIRGRVIGLPTRIRALLVTHLHDAAPDHIQSDPNPSIWPLLSAIAVTVLFIGSIFTAWALVWGAIPVTIALIGWFWPTEEQTQVERELEIKPQDARTTVLDPVRAAL